MNTCNNCKANRICDHNQFGFENCNNFIPDEVSELVSDLYPILKSMLDIFSKLEASQHIYARAIEHGELESLRKKYLGE